MSELLSFSKFCERGYSLYGPIRCLDANVFEDHGTKFIDYTGELYVTDKNGKSYKCNIMIPKMSLDISSIERSSETLYSGGFEFDTTKEIFVGNKENMMNTYFVLEE